MYIRAMGGRLWINDLSLTLSKDNEQVCPFSCCGWARERKKDDGSAPNAEKDFLCLADPGTEKGRCFGDIDRGASSPEMDDLGHTPLSCPLSNVLRKQRFH